MTLEEPAHELGSRRSRRVRVALLAAVVLVAGAAATGTLRVIDRPAKHPPAPPVPPAAPRASDVHVTVDRSAPRQVATLAIGATHGQYSVDPWGSGVAVDRGKRLLAAATHYQAQHIYGFGALNPEPRPGQFAWESLDRRIALIRSTGADPVITLCCAPDWMTTVGTDTSTYPELPPTPRHVADFAALARAIALRYPDVRHFQVWNEMKGFWNSDLANWDYVAYTNLYNAVYDTLKSVNPAIAVGGPYLVIDGPGEPITDSNNAVLAYWLVHSHGADFISLSHRVVDWDAPAAPPKDAILAATVQYSQIEDQIRQKTTLPIWWSEDYIDAKPSRISYANHAFQGAALASMLYHEEMSGAAASFRFQPQGVATKAFEGDQESLFSDTRTSDGGKPFPAYDAYRIFHRDFPPGTPLLRATSSSVDVEVLASRDVTLLINKRPAPVTVELDGAIVTLARYEVRRLPAPSRPSP